MFLIPDGWASQRMAQKAGYLLARFAVFLALLVGAAVLYAGVKVLPLYLANSRFQSDLDARTRMMRPVYASTQQVRDAVYRGAQSEGVPVAPDDIDVKATPSGFVIIAEYQVTADLHFFHPVFHFRLQSPEPKQTLTAGRIQFLSILGVLFGGFWFLQGFLIFRKYRVLADTPSSPIRGVAMGLVELHGTAVGERTLYSPVSNVPCFWYRVDFERWSGNSRGGGRWSSRLSDSAWVHFRLRDESGEIRVEPQGAEFDLEPTAQREVSRHKGLLAGHAWEMDELPDPVPGLPLPDSQLRRYLVRATTGMHTADFQGADLADRNSVKWELKKSRFRFAQLFTSPAALLQLSAPGISVDAYNHTPDDYRLTEYCIVPGGTYDVIGTCLTLPEGEGGELVVAKGSNAPTFLITNRTEKDIEGALRARARLHILGGALLILGSIAVMLESLGIIF